MTLSRRRTIALVGGGLVFAATAASATYLATRTPTRARAPWAAAGQHADPRLHALSYAILAPNPHNRQPWVAELVGDDALRIHRDPARNLPETDPFDRQLTIGMGAFLDLLQIAASATGHAVLFDMFPQGEHGPVAEARLVAGARRDPLFDQVLHRRTNRNAYADRPIPALSRAALMPLADVITDPARVADLRDLTVEAWRIEAETTRTMAESVALTRVGKAAINAAPDGISLGGPFLESLALVGLLDPADQLDPASDGFRQMNSRINASLRATPAYAAIVSDGNTRADQLAAGARWLRLHLTATSLGLTMQPVSQALQEFPEMREMKARAEALLASAGQTVQMLGRLGEGPAVPPAPRWPLETRMRHA